MLSPLASLVRLASVLLCLIVSVSFVLFVVHDTSVASAHQQDVLNSNVPPGSPLPAGAVAAPHPHGTSVRHTIDEASSDITSPFSAITDGWSSEWLKRGVLLLLALAIYGLGLGYLARSIRVRA